MKLGNDGLRGQKCIWPIGPAKRRHCGQSRKHRKKIVLRWHANENTQDGSPPNAWSSRCYDNNADPKIPMFSCGFDVVVRSDCGICHEWKTNQYYFYVPKNKLPEALSPSLA